MHAGFRIADRHGTHGVAVVRVAKGNKFGPAGHAAIEPELRRHFHRDFHGHGAGVGKEDVIKRTGCDRRQTRGKPFGRLVRETAEHHVRHERKLPLHRGPNVRMVVAVTHPLPFLLTAWNC